MHYYKTLDLWVDRIGHGFYGFAAVEVASMGIPVVTQISSYAMKFVEDCPFLITDKAHMTEKILRVVDDPNYHKALGIYCRSYIQKNHSTTRLAERYVELYGDVLYA